MGQKNNENQATERKSSTENESVEETLAKVSEALDASASTEEALEKLGEQPQAEEAPAEPAQAAAEDAADASEEEDEDFELPSTYKKDVRELVKKLPKGFEELGKNFIKRAKEIERDRQKFYSEYQSKTAFAGKIAKSVNPYLDFWTAKGISPEIGVERAAKLDYLIQTNPQAAAKFVLQMANLRKISLDDDEIELLNQNKQQQGLTQEKPLTQDEIRQITREEFERNSQQTAKFQSNMQVIESIVKESVNGKPKYPGMQDDEFVRSLTPTVEALMQRPGMTFEKAVRTAYLAEGGEVAQGGAPQPSVSQNRDAQKIERLKVASTIRPANSSSNSLNLDDIEIPDSIEDTIRLAERLTAGRS